MPKHCKGRDFVSPDVPSSVHNFSDGYLSFWDTNEPEGIATIAIISQYWTSQSDIDFISLEQIVECVGRAHE